MNRCCGLKQLGAGFLIGAFCLAFEPAHAGEINLFALYKRQVYVQTNAAPAAPRCSPFVFDAVIKLANSNSVSAGAIAAPGGKQATMPIAESREFLPSAWFASAGENYAARESLDADWPSGRYTFLVAGSRSPLNSAALNLSGDTYPTNAPHIQNFDEAQNVDASRDFVLRWEGFSDGTTNDMVFVSVRRISDQTAVYSTPFLTGEGALDGTATWALIPAGTLAPGTDYDVYVRFDKVVERNLEVPGIIGQASYATGTHFILKTGAGQPGS